MRAVLFASATATTSGGRRRRSPITHGRARELLATAAPTIETTPDNAEADKCPLLRRPHGHH